VMGSSDATAAAVPAPPPAARTELTVAESRSLVLIILASALAAGLVGRLWAILIQKYTTRLIWLTFGALIVVQLGFAVWVTFFSAAQINGIGILVFLGSLFTMLFGVIMKRWVPLCTALFSSAVQVHEDNPSLSRVIYFAMICKLFWLLFAGLAMSSVSFQGGGVLLPMFAFFLFGQLARAVVHGTAAATAASSYFVTHEVNPVLNAFKRCTTTSFGSLCYGSLLVSSVQTFQMFCSRRPYPLSAHPYSSGNCVCCFSQHHSRKG